MNLLKKLLGLYEPPVLLYTPPQVIEKMDTHTFSTSSEGVEMVWEIEPLWDYTSELKSTQWEIPDTFKDAWYWGQEHPADHLQRCLEADLSYPILVWDGVVIDGCHRIVKALAMGETTIEAKIIELMPPPDKDCCDLSIKETETLPSKWTFEDMVKLVEVCLL